MEAKDSAENFGLSVQLQREFNDRALLEINDVDFARSLAPTPMPVLHHAIIHNAIRITTLSSTFENRTIFDVQSVAVEPMITIERCAPLLTKRFVANKTVECANQGYCVAVSKDIPVVAEIIDDYCLVENDSKITLKYVKQACVEHQKMLT